MPRPYDPYNEFWERIHRDVERARPDLQRAVGPDERPVEFVPAAASESFISYEEYRRRQAAASSQPSFIPRASDYADFSMSGMAYPSGLQAVAPTERNPVSVKAWMMAALKRLDKMIAQGGPARYTHIAVVGNAGLVDCAFQSHAPRYTGDTSILRFSLPAPTIDYNTISEAFDSRRIT